MHAARADRRLDPGQHHGQWHRALVGHAVPQPRHLGAARGGRGGGPPEPRVRPDQLYLCPGAQPGHGDGGHGERLRLLGQGIDRPVLAEHDEPGRNRHGDQPVGRGRDAHRAHPLEAAGHRALLPLSAPDLAAGSDPAAARGVVPLGQHQGAQQHRLEEPEYRRQPAQHGDQRLVYPAQRDRGQPARPPPLQARVCLPGAQHDPARPRPGPVQALPRGGLRVHRPGGPGRRQVPLWAVGANRYRVDPAGLHAGGRGEARVYRAARRRPAHVDDGRNPGGRSRR